MIHFSSAIGGRLFPPNGCGTVGSIYGGGFCVATHTWGKLYRHVTHKAGCGFGTRTGDGQRRVAWPFIKDKSHDLATLLILHHNNS